MRSFLAGFAAFAAATTVADAGPALSTNVGTQPGFASYIDGGLEGGVNDGYLILGGRGELGTRVAPDLWIHAILAEGTLGQLFATGSGSYTQLRAGADLMSCGSTGALCIFVGGDLGYQHTVWRGHDDPIFLVGGNDPGNSADTTDEHDRMIGVGRIGLDIGGANVRWRPSLEGSMANDGARAVTATQSIAYRF